MRELLKPIADMRSTMRCPRRQVTFFGVFKTGKTTLLNALIGTPVLPMRANRATGVITRIRYGDQPSAQIMRITPEGVRHEEAIAFDDLTRYILLDVSEIISKPMAGVAEVSVSIPLPFLARDCTLVDTPGLLDNETLSRGCRDELTHSDFAVMVLAADKLLGEAEKEAAAQTQTLLNGNLAFVINRLDLIAEAERSQVIEWARATLAGLGNPLVGQPRIFALSARGALEARGAGMSIPDDWVQFEQWLGEMLQEPLAFRVAVLSRLGVLAWQLAAVHSHAQARLAAAQATVDRLREDEAQARADYLGQLHGAVLADRQRLAQVVEQTEGLGAGFAADWEERTRVLMAADKAWADAGKLQNCFEQALEAYAHALFFAANAAVQESGLRVPVLEPATLCDAVRITAADESYNSGATAAAVGVGMAVAGPIGAALGGALVYLFSRTGPKEKTLDLVRQEAARMRPIITRRAQDHLAELDAALDAHLQDSVSAEWISPQMQAANRDLAYFLDLCAWCSGFSGVVNDLKQKLTSGSEPSS